ncbi:hypothetical protein CDD83_4439 [Cordyceps sp. RAO-2017]|nr:hypothetical protein CDD83_4439 [Cordyceps sp. RAO-2017]
MKQPNLPKKVAAAVGKILTHPDLATQDKAFAIVRAQPNLPTEVASTLAKLLEHPDDHTRSNAAAVLGGQRDLPRRLTNSLMEYLERSDAEICSCALNALGGGDLLAQEIITVAKLLNSEKEKVRVAAFHALMNVSLVPLTGDNIKIMQAASRYLKRRDPKECIKAISEHTGWCYHIADMPMTIIPECLDHDDKKVQGTAFTTLIGAINLSSQASASVAKWIAEPKSGVTKDNLFSLADKRYLKENELVINAARKRLYDPDDGIRYGVMQVLGGLSNSSDELVALVNSQAEEEISAVLLGLEYRKNLSDELLIAISNLLRPNHKSTKMYDMAICILSQNKMPAKAYTAVEEAFQDGSIEFSSRRLVLSNLWGGGNMPSHQFQSILVRSPLIGLFYQSLLNVNGGGDFFWCVEDGHMSIRYRKGSDQVRRFPVEDKEALIETIVKARGPNYPSVAGEFDFLGIPENKKGAVEEVE